MKEATTMATERKKCSTAGHSAGFTLIELLITVAIITVLAAMLMPALNKAREKARSITCTNNMKQTILALNQYIDSFDTYIPHDSQKKWGWLLVEMNLLENGRCIVCPGAQKTPAWKSLVFYTYSLTPEICASSPADKYWKGQYSYGMNQYFISSPLKFSTIKTPSSKVFLADCLHKAAPSPYYGVWSSYQPYSTWGILHSWHTAATNVIFADGHAEAIAGIDNASDDGYAQYMYNSTKLKDTNPWEPHQ